MSLSVSGNGQLAHQAADYAENMMLFFEHSSLILQSVRCPNLFRRDIFKKGFPPLTELEKLRMPASKFCNGKVPLRFQ